MDITDTLNPSDNFDDVKFVWFFSLSDESSLPLRSFKFDYPYLLVSVDTSGIAKCPPVYLDPGAARLPKPKRSFLTVMTEAFQEQCFLHYQVVTEDGKEDRDAWRRLEFKGKLIKMPVPHFASDLSDDERTQLKALGKPDIRQLLEIKLELDPVVTMSGDWDKVPRKARPKPSKAAGFMAALGKGALTLATAAVDGASKLASDAATDAADRKLLQAEKGVWHSNKPYPQLFEEIQNWLSHPIAAGDRFSVSANPNMMQLQASLSFSEYVAPQYPDCPRTITLMLNFTPLEHGTTVTYDWVVVQELHAGSFHGPQMIRIVNNGIRHWCQVDTDPAL